MPNDRWLRRWVLLGATLIAAFSARPHAGSWNDGSRLATVESLVDRGTMAIDESIFVNVPKAGPGQPSPYPIDDELLQSAGTKDKLFIRGHFYSDKSPIPAFPMAAVYQIWRWCGGPSASDRPDWFCLLMTWCSSGIAYAIAVCCIFGIGRRIGLPAKRNIAIAIFFALGTVALPYAQQVNNHILLLAVAAAVFWLLLGSKAYDESFGERRGVSPTCSSGIHVGLTPRRSPIGPGGAEQESQAVDWWNRFWLGTLVGIGYTIDLAAGPLLCLTVGAFLLRRLPNRSWVWLVILAALPWVALHHVVNFQIGGTFGPANAVPAYFEWPGSPFSSANMTGGWNHSSIGSALLYAFDMLLGKKGFLGHNLALFLPLAAFSVLLRRRYAERPVVITSLIWATATWLLYAATSNNLSGGCCSIRWFVPLLAPGFLAIGLALRERPSLMRDVFALGIGGLLLGIGMAVRGPWFMKLMPGYWTIYGGTVMCWAVVRFLSDRRMRSVEVEMIDPSKHREAA